MGNLTKDKVRELAEPGRCSDGDGLMLQIRPNGGKSWLLRVQINGRRRDVGLGCLEDVPLTTARAKAADMRKLARAGIDPLEERKKERVVVPTFEQAARQVHKEMLPAWKNGKHTDQWLTTLEKYAFPKLRNLRVDEIEGPLIRDVLAEIWLNLPRPRRRQDCKLQCQSASRVIAHEFPNRSDTRGYGSEANLSGHVVCFATHRSYCRTARSAPRR